MKLKTATLLLLSSFTFLGLQGCDNDSALENAGEDIDRGIENTNDNLNDAADDLNDAADDLDNRL